MTAEAVRQAFASQAHACASLGSPFTAALCRFLGTHLDEKSPVGSHCLNWRGDPEASADSVPLRLCGALHALVLSDRDPQLAKAYPPHCDLPDETEIARAIEDHASFIIDFMKSPPQTNEVARSGVIWPGFMEISTLTGKPLALIEVGASAGLNLNARLFGYDLGGRRSGAPESRLQLKPEWSGPAPQGDPVIESASGCDINPLDPGNPDHALRLRSYVWPDQAERVKRMDAALEIAKAHRPVLDREDAIGWLRRKLAARQSGVVTVIYSTIAWQYLPEHARAEGDALIRAHGGQATVDGPLAWLRFENDQKPPGATVHLNLWPHGIDMEIGRADFHGRWVKWFGAGAAR